MIGRFSTRMRLSLLVRPIFESSVQLTKPSELSTCRKKLQLEIESLAQLLTIAGVLLFLRASLPICTSIFSPRALQYTRDADPVCGRAGIDGARATLAYNGSMETPFNAAVNRCATQSHPYDVFRDNASSSLVWRINSLRSISRYFLGSRLLLVHSNTATRFCRSISVG